MKRIAKWRAAAKLELEPKGGKRYIRRDAKGRIKESDDVGRSLSQEKRTKAQKAAKAGRGDRKPAKAKSRKKTSARK
ncbi:hypothetical protein [Bradyrhizobium monzae]|uniref:hypothetical protein n=1 Tax=Bradyrhizobium sp. Oc8 TaxID=2876780 RepID=UPI001F358F6F|nr:hypothetical protein [Bradyrhizobium sp. Oc8]